MNTKKKSILVVILAVLFAVLLGCAFIKPKNITANAAMSVTASDAVIIDELAYDYTAGSWKGSFDPDTVSKLYGAISGTSGANATLKSVENALSSSGSTESVTGAQVITATDLAAVSTHSGKDIVVTLGGYKWTVVYVSNSISGDVIATLLLTDKLASGTFASWSATSTNTQANPYPANMYSTSQIRSVLMGTQYSTSSTVLSTVAQGEAKQDAGFKVLASDFGSTGIIATPKDMSWQEAENSVSILQNVSFNGSITPRVRQWNDAWGRGLTDYSTKATNYETKANYFDWENDYFWVPSVAERAYVSSSVQGMWQLTANQRKQTGTKYASSATYNTTWFRTGTVADTYISSAAWATYGSVNYTMVDSGEGVGTAGNSGSVMSIRPAMHLNLSAMDKQVLAEPSDVTAEPDGSNTKTLIYDGSVKSLDNVLPDWYLNVKDYFVDYADITYSYKNTGDTTAFDTANPGAITAATNIINAGRYEIAIKLKPNSPFTWFDTSGAAVTEKKVILTIEQKEIKFDYRLFDTSGGGSTLLTGTAVSYTNDSTKTYAVKPYSSTETIPGGTTNLFPDWKMEYEGTANDGTVYAKSTTVPTLAGAYKATLTDANSGTSNYLLKGSTTVYNYTVEKAEVNLPSFDGNKTYNANAQDFTLSDYETDILKIAGISVGAVTLTANGTGTQYKSADNYFVVDYDATDKKLSATNSAEYTVTFDLVDTNNYTWSSAVATGAKTKTFTIDKKELVIKFLSPLSNNQNFNLKTNTKGNITAEYTDGGETPDGGSAEEPQLILSYVFTNGTITGGKIQAVGASKIGDVSLDLSTLIGDGNVFSVGTYTLTFELAPDTAAAVNKNYKLGASATQALTVTAGEASIDDIEIVYNTVRGENNGDANANIPAAGLTYAYDKTYGATEYKIYLDFSGIDYLEYVNGTSSLTYAYADGTNTINKAGTVTVTAQIRSKDTNHNLPATYDVTATNKFKSYTNNNDGTATVTFEIVINKAVANVSGSEIPLMYQREGSSDVLAYDPAKPPEYNGKPVTVTLASSVLFPDTVKSVVFDDALIRQTTAGNYTIRATVTLSDNYVTATGSSTVIVNIPWSIAKEQIDLVWSNIVYADDYFNDSSLAHLQLTLLDLTDAQKGNVEYEFYKEVGGAISTVPMTEAEIKALCTNDRFTETTPTYIYVKAVLTADGEKKYQLEDDASKNPKRFRLGGNMTQINLTVSEAINGFEYGDELDVTKLFTLKNSETNDVWDSDYYDITVRKGGDVLCSLADFKPSEADAGEYTFVIDIKPEYADSYVLDRSNKVAFVINAKEVELPTLSDIIFSGEYINVEDYLGGSWEQIKSLVTLGGDFKDKRNVSATGYTLILELNSNYRWAYPEAVSAVKALLGYSATDVEITEVSPNVASMKWNITPLVVDATNLWNKGANGATLNLPDAVTKLITAETLAIGYKYYDDAGQFIEEPELKGGKSFRVEAIFSGIDADMGNVLFKTGEGSFSATSERVSYTVPQSGAAAFIGNVRDFVTKTWLGLPIWAWLAIGLAVLILLIIIIAVACKRRKSKEERAEAKARKEEERQMQREKLEAERELAKAKQEAELEKIRAQAGFAGMGMAGAGMASMAMQQASPQPQPQQPMQMQQPVQQPQMQAQTVQQMPMQMPVQMPSQAAQPSGGMNVSEMMAMMFAQFAGMKADNADKEIAALKSDKEITALKTEIEIMKLKMEQLKDSKSVQSVDGKHELTPEFLGAVIASAMRSNGVLPQPAPVAELPQQTAENTSVNCEYPPDAVITTTTTVDTTQKQPARRNERSVKDEFMDVDGFYEEI